MVLNFSLLMYSHVHYYNYALFNLYSQEAAVLSELENRMRHSDRLLDQKERVVGELQSTLKKEVNYICILSIVLLIIYTVVQNKMRGWQT